MHDDLTIEEYNDWLLFYEQKGFGVDRWDYQLAMIVQALCGSKKTKITDWMPWYERDIFNLDNTPYANETQEQYDNRMREVQEAYNRSICSVIDSHLPSSHPK